MSHNKLKKNYDESAIASIIESTKTSEKQVIGWRFVGDKKVTVDLKIRVIRKFRDEIVFMSLTDEGNYTLQSLVNGAEKLNFYFPEDMALFQVEVKSFESKNDLVVKYPKMMAHIDRRKFLRLFVEENLKARVEFSKKNHGQLSNSQIFSKPCFDLSAGGLSFIVSRTELRFFQAEDMIDMNLILNDFETKLRGKIVNIFEIEPNKTNKLNYKGWKICLDFQGIDPKVQQKINSFVFGHIEIDKEAL